MSWTKILVVALIAGIIGGCTSTPSSRKTLLTVDFKPGQTLKYKFVNSRNMTVDWGAMKGGKTKISKSSESLEMVVLYTPVEVDPYGVSTIRADCESAKANRTSDLLRQQDWQEAAESFAGRSWTFTVDARGKVVDGSGFRDVLLQVGQRAFRADRSKGLIKEPDMLFDVVAMQWFLWDSVSSISNPAKGVAVGDKWKSVLSVPAAMVLFAARDVNYTLSEIRVQDANNRIAVIDSSYSLRWPNPPEWPVPYTEPFQMSGVYGFLRKYETHDLQGHGQELFNIDAGRTERCSQSYTVHASASYPMGFPGNLQITIDQNMTMELLAPSVPGK